MAQTFLNLLDCNYKFNNFNFKTSTNLQAAILNPELVCFLPTYKLFLAITNRLNNLFLQALRSEQPIYVQIHKFLLIKETRPIKI
jgi:hypothetical protein